MIKVAISRKRKYVRYYGISKTRKFIRVDIGLRTWYLTKYTAFFSMRVVKDNQGDVMVTHQVNRRRITVDRPVWRKLRKINSVEV